MAKASELSKTEKYLNIRDRNLKATIGAGEPKINKESYKINLIRAMTYYHVYEDSKTMRKWVENYIGSDKTKLSKLNAASDFSIETLAILIRLKERDQYLHENELSTINKKLQGIFGKNNSGEADEQIEIEKSAKVTNLVPKTKRSDEFIPARIGELEGEIDIFILSGYKSTFDPLKYLTDHKVSAVDAKTIGKWFSKQTNEYIESLEGKDQQLVEAYSHMTKAKLKALIAFVTNIMNSCNQQKVSVIRKPRVSKPKPSATLVKNLKYCQEYDEEFKLTSVHPTKIIKASDLVIYDTKTRRLSVYRSQTNEGLSVKGSTILGFDINKSEIRTLRKPEEWFNSSKTKAEFNFAFKKLTTKASPPNGRINANCIIVAVY